MLETEPKSRPNLRELILSLSALQRTMVKMEQKVESDGENPNDHSSVIDKAHQQLKKVRSLLDNPFIIF